MAREEEDVLQGARLKSALHLSVMPRIMRKKKTRTREMLRAERCDKVQSVYSL